MRRAMWTMAAAGLVLMGSDGAVRSDCPPANQGCTLPPGGSWTDCLWDAMHAQTCSSTVNQSCRCKDLACYGFQASPAYSGQYATLSGERPEGCCNEIQHGQCHVAESRLCYFINWCETEIGHSPYFCTQTNPCVEPEGPPQPQYRFELWLMFGETCCYDAQ